jgi:hypothetical protein
MPNINETTDTDLKVIEELTELGWKRGDTLLYQQEYLLTPEQNKIYEGKKSVKPDITLTDIHGNILAMVLESYLSDLRMEIADTDSMDFRESLKKKKDVLKKVLLETLKHA